MTEDQPLAGTARSTVPVRPEPPSSAAAMRARAREIPSHRPIPAGLDETVIALVIADFYAKVRADPLLGPVFAAIIPDAGWPRHLGVLQDFWSSMLLGSGRYGGRPMPAHIALDGVDDRHFARWLTLFRETVETVATPEAAALFINRAERVANSFRLGIATHRGLDSTALEPMHAPPRSP